MKTKTLKRTCRALTAAAAVAGCLFTQIAAPVVSYAAAPKATVDETMYLNLDSYGGIEKANVVKGINFNSQSSYTDHGNYLEVTNMSSEEKPEIRNGTVTFRKPEKNGKFFFQGTIDPKEAKVPWTFDVTYKVNGVVTDAEKVAGTSGLIEMTIDALPNKDVPEYMQNNFVLAVAIPIDNEKYYSYDAPDAQIANVGQYSCAVFEALPGKEGHFTVRLGSDSFETVGAIIMMTPVTVKDIENVKDLKELEDKFRNNTNAMFDDVEALMDNVTDVSNQLSLTNDMLAGLQAGKNELHSSSDAIFNGNDVAIQDLRDLSGLLTPVDTSLKTMQWMVYDVNKSLNTMDQDLMDTSSKMKNLSTRLKELGSSLNAVDSVSEKELKEELADIQKGLTKVESGVKSGTTAVNNLGQITGNTTAQKQAEELVTKYKFTDTEYQEDYLPQAVIGYINSYLSDQGTVLSDMTADQIEAMQPMVTALLYLYDEVASAAHAANAGVTQDMLTQQFTAEVTNVVNQLIIAGKTVEEAKALAPQMVISAGASAASAQNKENASRFIESAVATRKLADSAKSLAANTVAADKTSAVQNLSTLNSSLGEIAGGLAETYAGIDADEMISEMAAVSSDIEEISEYAGGAAFQTARFLTSARNLCGDMDELVSTMNQYYQDIQDAITNTDNVLLEIQKTSDDLAGTLQTVNDSIRAAEQDLSKAADSGLEAGREAVDNTGKIVENVDSLKNSGADLRKSINDELDKQEEESNVLNMDPNAAKVSFTSSENQEPTTVAIVARTAELSVKKAERAAVMDAEQQEVKTTAVQRIVNVFVQLGNIIKTVLGML